MPDRTPLAAPRTPPTTPPSAAPPTAPTALVVAFAAPVTAFTAPSTIRMMSSHRPWPLPPGHGGSCLRYPPQGILNRRAPEQISGNSQILPNNVLLQRNSFTLFGAPEFPPVAGL